MDLNQISNRRKSLSLLSTITSSIILTTTPPPTLANPVAPSPQQPPPAPSLKFLKSPLNVKTGATLYDAESTYPLKFVTYLTRFLISFDPACQRWWYVQAQDIPRKSGREQVEEYRLKQFAEFAASVEVGLREYRDVNGPERLMGYMLGRYCPSSMSEVTLNTFSQNTTMITPLLTASTTQKNREVREARRQIVLMFSLMERSQPTDMITTELANIENATLSDVEVISRGTGYAPGYGSPKVYIEEPEGSQGVRAEGRAVMGKSGRVLRVDIVDRGLGYNKKPMVEIDKPIGGGKEAKAVAVMSEKGGRGRIERIRIVEQGQGYGDDEEVKVRISPPDSPVSQGGYQATAVTVMELEVKSIEITSPGSGYAAEKPVSIKVDPPPITARTNMNDPELLKTKGVDGKVLANVIAEAAKGKDGTGGGGGCYGRGCYDEPVVAEGITKSDVTAGSSFRYEGDKSGVSEKAREEVDKRGDEATQENKMGIRAMSSGRESEAPRLPTLGGGQSSTARLLTLFPEGVGLVFDEKKKVYVLTAGPEALESGLVVGGGQGVSPKPLDPDFGPRGRSPVEREKDLTPGTYLRFMAAGALCCSTVHLAVTPLDVVKTKVQTNPIEYPNPFLAFKKVMGNGMGTFFTGWDTTFVGFFVWGGIGYTLTEFLRRYFSIALSAPKDGSWEIPIVIVSASMAAFAGCFFLCPFETIRIRMVSGGGEGGLLSVGKNIVNESGVGALFNAVPAFLLKEIPFAAAKFAVFDASTEALYDAFPAAREDLRLSLAVSLTGGCLGGIVAAFVSNPADAVISELKKVNKGGASKVEVEVERGGGEGGVEVGVGAEDTTLASSPSTSMTAVSQPPQAPKPTIRQAYYTLYSNFGVSGLFRGLGIRIPFYCLVVSLQFFFYDSIRVLLGVGRDDLSLFLDVLGGALGELKGEIM